MCGNLLKMSLQNLLVGKYTETGISLPFFGLIASIEQSSKFEAFIWAGSCFAFSIIFAQMGCLTFPFAGHFVKTEKNSFIG